MKRIVLNIMTALVLTLIPAGSLAGTAYAACATGNSAKDQVQQGIVVTGGNCDDSGVTKAIAAAVNIMSLIVGVAAIIMIISSGLKYITSGGDAQKIGNAKSTITYALVGLVVAALAQLLVHFVLHQANLATGGR